MSQLDASVTPKGDVSNYIPERVYGEERIKYMGEMLRRNARRLLAIYPGMQFYPASDDPKVRKMIRKKTRKASRPLQSI
jgi:hypothetical protein